MCSIYNRKELNLYLSKNKAEIFGACYFPFALMLINLTFAFLREGIKSFSFLEEYRKVLS